MAQFESIYLASSSPRRKELLKQLGVSFELITNQFDETPFDKESPAEYVKRLAIGKARSAMTHPDYSKSIPILGADTIVVLEGELLGKPKDIQDARLTLRSLAGKKHQVFTSVALCLGEEAIEKTASSEVQFARLTDRQIDAYCATGEPFGKAGSYAIQGAAASFISMMSGSYTGVVGLPLYETSLLLEQMQVKYLLS
ncbi:MAG: septum formation inhibitor Maf [Kangiellaceae bacterium]|nr:septum formation inhibitor Maf [Kangiellaceae bacterium]